jgi:hypothetical protein
MGNYLEIFDKYITKISMIIFFIKIYDNLENIN